MEENLHTVSVQNTCILKQFETEYNVALQNYQPPNVIIIQTIIFHHVLCTILWFSVMIDMPIKNSDRGIRILYVVLLD